MSLLGRIFGQTGYRVPFDVQIHYADGTIGRLHIWGHDMREALRGVDYWMPLQVPATSVVITERKATDD